MAKYRKKPIVIDAELKRVRQVAEDEIGRLSRSHEALVAALKAWDDYGGFDTWEDTSRKANAMAEAIRSTLSTATGRLLDTQSSLPGNPKRTSRMR